MSIAMATMLCVFAVVALVLFWFIENRHLKECDRLLVEKKKAVSQ